MYIPIITENIAAESLGIFGDYTEAINSLIERLVQRNYIQNTEFLDIVRNVSLETQDELIVFLQDKVNGDFNKLRLICHHLGDGGFEQTWDIQVDRHEVF